MAFQGSDRTLTIAWQIVNGKWPGESLSLPLALSLARSFITIAADIRLGLRIAMGEGAPSCL